MRFLPLVGSLRRLCKALLLVLALVSWAQPALAERRVALVFGADAYAALRPLANGVNDAVAVQDLLAGLDFEVTLETDRDLRRMRRALVEFAEEAAGADLAVLFFAGHGVEIDGRNLLLPVDAGGATAAALAASALPLEEVVETLHGVVPAALVILDACRDDPFGGVPEGRGAMALPADAAEVRPGLGRVGRADGLLFAFAAAPGATASDGAGRNSPFTAALVRHLATPGLEVRSALTLVQQDVYDRSRAAQLPYVESGLPAAVFLAPDAEELPERARLLLAMAGIDADLRAQVERAAAARDMPLAPLYASAIEGGLAELGWEAREARLAEAADAFVETRERLLGLQSNDARVQALRVEAEGLLERGERQAALTRLETAIGIDAGAAAASAAVAVERRLSEADTRLSRAGVHAAGFAYAPALADYAAAADLYARATALARADGRDPPQLALSGETLALWELGELQLTIGDTGAAMASFRRWQAAAEARLAIDPEDSRLQRNLVVSLGRVGDVHREQGDLAAAAQAHGAALDLARRLVARDPGDADNLHVLSVSHSQVGLLLQDRGDLDGAARAYGKALAIIDTLAAQDPGNAFWQRNLWSMHNQIGDLKRARADPDGAERAYGRALTIAEALAAQDPQDIARQRELSLSQALIGRVLQDRGDLVGAMRAYEAMRAIAEDLAARDPANAERQRALSLSHHQTGGVRFELGDLAGAAADYRASLAIAERLAVLDPDNAVWQRDLSVAQNRLGDVLHAMDDRAGAARAYESDSKWSE